MYFRCRAAGKLVFAELFLIERAKPVRPMTLAKHHALAKAMAARRTCRQCGELCAVELPRTNRVCEPCRFHLGQLEPWDYLHDYVQGMPTLDPHELGAAA